MIRRARPCSVFKLVTLLVLAFALVVGGSTWSGIHAPPAASAQTPDLSLESTRQAYELLLDRFVYPLEPATLLSAAWVAALPPLNEANSTTDLSPPEFTGNRFEAWKIFSQRINEAWESSSKLDPPSKLTYPMIQAMAKIANEGHTAFRTPSEYQDYLAWQRNDERYEGIGVSFRGKNYIILEVFPGSPAESAGLRSGDQIIGADGFNLEGTELEEGRRRIRGPAGTAVELLIRRAALPEPFKVTVPRAQIKIEPVRWRMLDGDIGYLRIVGFPHPVVVTDVERALGEFDQRGVRGLVLDLRGNGGGRLDVGMRVASKFLGAAPIFQQAARNGEHRTVSSPPGFWERTGPIAVLTDGGTASMGEILSSALQEHDAATLFGAKTAGVVSAAQVYPLVDGSAIQVTVLEIRSFQGAQMNNVGVQPDVNVEVTPEELAFGTDPQLDRALEWLQAHPDYVSPGNAKSL